jgi:hypothetical protein
MQRFLKPLTFVVIFLFFLLFTSMPLWDPDFWWHINTGRYILEHRALPDEDPFSFTTPEGDTLRKEVLLKRYWLSQIILYLTYKIGGVSGVIIFRSLILTLTLLLIYRFLKDADPYPSLLSIVLTGSVFIYFTGERPQTLVFPLVIVMFIILEDYRKHQSRSILFLPLITLLWSNIHGSVLFAMGIIIIYLSTTLTTSLLKPTTNRKDLYIFVTICISAIITSLLTPVGIKQIISFYTFQSSVLKRLTVEFYSPIKALLYYGKYLSYYWISLLVIVSLATVSLKRLSPSTIIVLISTIALSLISARYIVFFILSTPLLFSHLRFTKGAGFLRWSALTLSAIVLIGLLNYFHPFNLNIRPTYPIETVRRFKETDGLRIFAYLEWGGFVGFNMMGARVFIDGRTLNEDVFIQYNTVLEGTEFKGQREWEWILDRYKVDMVILPWRDLITGISPGLIDRLRVSEKWRMIFFNDNEVVFIRR